MILFKSQFARGMTALVALILLFSAMTVAFALSALAHGGHTYCGTGTHKPNWYTTDKYFGGASTDYHEYDRYRFGIYTGITGRWCP